MLECIMNISEGRDLDVVRALGRAAGPSLLDIHTDPDHHRSVFTMVGEAAPRAVATLAIDRIDLREHTGAHPRIGVVDVVPFVALVGSTFDDAREARDHFAVWAGDVLGVPCFVYGPERTLPELRRDAWTTLHPDTGPDQPHRSAGAMAVGVREPLVAYNVWLRDADLTAARAIAREIRGPGIRALGLQVGSEVQVSMNLVDPLHVGPAEAYDRVAARAHAARAELVGLLPEAALRQIDPDRWAELDLDATRTIESRLPATQ